MQSQSILFRLFRAGCLLTYLYVSPLNAQADCIGVFYAIDGDLKTLVKALNANPRAASNGDRSLQNFTASGHEIIAIKMGSGPVETALSCQTLLSKYRCDVAFSLGPVGTLDDTIPIGSWLLIQQAVAYQKGSWQPMGFSISPKSTLQMPDKGIARVKDILPKLLAEAKSAKAASGEAFIASDSYRQQLRDQTEAQVVDMNFFGLMTTCQANNVPLVSWRIVSDKADDNASEDFRKFVETYDGAGGSMLAEVIRKLPPNPESPDSYPAIKKALETP